MFRFEAISFTLFPVICPPMIFVVSPAFMVVELESEPTCEFVYTVPTPSALPLPTLPPNVAPIASVLITAPAFQPLDLSVECCSS